MKCLSTSFSQHPIEALLGDAQDLQELGDGQPRPAGDEIENPMVRPTESVGFEEPVRIAHEITIGEEKQLDQVVHRLRVAQARVIGLAIAGSSRDRRLWAVSAFLSASARSLGQ